jgi:hypothetical protein
MRRCEKDGLEVYRVQALFPDFRLRDRLRPPRDEHRQQVERLRRDMDFSLADPDLSGFRVEGDVVEVEAHGSPGETPHATTYGGPSPLTHLRMALT